METIGQVTAQANGEHPIDDSGLEPGRGLGAPGAISAPVLSNPEIRA